MKITPIKTPIIKPGDDILKTIKDSIKEVPEGSVLAITSKIISLGQNNIHSKDKTDKHELVKQESELYTDPTDSQYHTMLSIKDGILAVSAGIDESNAENVYLTLPKNPYQAAAQIWQFLRQEYNVKNVGVVVTDSMSLPLKWGVVGRSLSYCGFKALKNLIGKPDLFGRPLEMSQMNIAEGLASSAVLEMGESDESTPLALIENIKHIEFVDQPPSPEEIRNLLIGLEDDIYAPVLKKAEWKKGEASKI